MINHKLFGIGEVVKKEIVGDYTYIVARFDTGEEMRFVVPQSFETGAVEALGSLKDEVEKAIADRKARLATSALTSTPVTTTKKTSVKTIATSPVASAFEDYLIQEGYSVETDSGNPSTVYAYVNAVESVRTEEGISWDTLRRNIDPIVSKYDEGGPMSWFGAKSNKTVINALKRFSEFAGKP